MSANLERCINQYIPHAERAEVKRILYGRADDLELKPSARTSQICAENLFEVRAFKFVAQREELRAPRIVRVAAVQHAIVLPTTADISEQRAALQDKVGKLIRAAAASGVNVICLAEAWNMPFALSTQDIQPWIDFAEDAENGHTTQFLMKLAGELNMVIVSPIIERDCNGVLANAAVVISNRGQYLGKHHKFHIPCMEGPDNEATYYPPGDLGHAVFETDFGRIAVNICYGRHHPQHWMMFGLNGAEIVFNPSATELRTAALWEIEARNAAIANGYFTVAINRVGIEHFNVTGSDRTERVSFGPYNGSSYVAAPDGTRTPALSVENDGLLIAEIDLNLCRQVKDHWGLQMTQRLAEYGRDFTKSADPDYVRQIITQK